jgi:hypothetical protein
LIEARAAATKSTVSENAERRRRAELTILINSGLIYDLPRDVLNVKNVGHYDLIRYRGCASGTYDS